MTLPLSRRQALMGAGAMVGAGWGMPAGGASEVQDRPKSEPFGYCLNTSTLRGQKLPLKEEIQLAAKAGYHALEPWISEIDQYQKAGGSLKDLAKELKDLGLTVESSIGFAEWVVDDEARRAKGLETAKRDMDLVAQIGGKRMAAPPAGATDRADLDLRRVAERYRTLCELGDTLGVVPEVEVWGSSKVLSRLGDAAFVAIECGHPRACILADVFHLHKGGSSFGSVRLLSGSAMHVMHMNDYPSDPPREKVTDAHRVYPGDGVAPLQPLFRDLAAIGYRGFLSLELFNREYWKQDAETVARTGIEKMRQAVRKAFE
jgi:sugar phosphate isomerase/epimerase